MSLCHSDQSHLENWDLVDADIIYIKDESPLASIMNTDYHEHYYTVTVRKCNYLRENFPDWLLCLTL